MKPFPPLMFFSTTLFLLLSSSAALDTISPSRPIKDGATLISDGETFELGFFSPGKSTNRYLGIWFKQISTFTVVWVANRETPITDRSGVFELSDEGPLLIRAGNNTVIWSNNSTISAPTVNSPVAQLLDTGNLVVRDESETNTVETPIWQSFDYPGDTLLPGQKFGKDLVTGKQTNLTSWNSPDDPSIGRYKVFLNTNGYPQTFEVEDDQVLYSRFGPWNGEGFRGLPRENTNPIYSVEFVVNQKEIYYMYKLQSQILQRIILSSDGSHLQSSWINRTREWGLYGNVVVDNCSKYGRCGPYGRCSIETYPPCNCMEGFEPKVPEEWNSGDWSSGCRRKTAFECGNIDDDGFLKVSGVKFPDTQRSWYNQSMSLGECEKACRRNCSCTAYANLDIRNGGSGCLLWFDDLMDIREYDDNQDLYVRMATSELAGKSSFKRKKLIIVVVLSVSSIGVLVSSVAYTCRMKKKGRGCWTHTLEKNRIRDDQLENLDELPYISLHKIVKATNTFHIDNKIGEGGFGPVYKGVLPNGQVIAVKRLSETSQQGPNEFKNEVMCIAKLQHRNLVKLLGYCIDGNENILIYEYMDNKSLDSFLFDHTRSSMLDWAQRFHIILGTARGILYLHQDSRLQIIHRDLKAANILLDSEMNPKISDFGLARKFVGHDAMARTRNVVGTYGYISPEYAVHGHISVKSDVFSFGVIVLEIISGKKNRGFSHEGHSDNLLGHTWRLYKEEKSLELIDASLRNSCVVTQVLRSIHVGLLCVQQHAEDRPTMSTVVLMLTSEVTLHPPKQPAFFTEEIYQELELGLSLNEYMITLLYGR